MNLTTQVTGFGHTTIKADTEELIITVSGGSSLQSHIDTVNKILAAPDLLEACELATDYLITIAHDPNHTILQQLKIAIAKTKGE